MVLDATISREGDRVARANKTNLTRRDAGVFVKFVGKPLSDTNEGSNAESSVSRRADSRGIKASSLSVLAKLFVGGNM